MPLRNAMKSHNIEYTRPYVTSCVISRTFVGKTTLLHVRAHPRADLLLSTARARGCKTGEDGYFVAIRGTESCYRVYNQRRRRPVSKRVAYSDHKSAPAAPQADRNAVLLAAVYCPNPQHHRMPDNLPSSVNYTPWSGLCFLSCMCAVTLLQPWLQEHSLGSQPNIRPCTLHHRINLH